MIQLKSPQEVDAIARGGAIIAGLLSEVRRVIRAGVSTAEIDLFCDECIRDHDGATPAFKGLYGFPGSVCISLNEEIVHGIPSPQRVLRNEDIVSIDVGVRLDGWCSDSAWTFPVGEPSRATLELLRTSEISARR
jgi:methionyl aminopeptidase